MRSGFSLSMRTRISFFLARTVGTTRRITSGVALAPGAGIRSPTDPSVASK